jgi:TfoX/Sxy family transcriptional regulator of competence genes
MAWTKAPQSLIDLFAACLPERPGLTRRKMFGYPAAFANGNMFAGLFQDQAIARLPPALRAELDAEFGVVSFEPMPGRPMRAYAVIPPELLDDEDRYAAILDAAYAFAAALPPKPAKPRKKAS